MRSFWNKDRIFQEKRLVFNEAPSAAPGGGAAEPRNVERQSTLERSQNARIELASSVLKNNFLTAAREYDSVKNGDLKVIAERMGKKEYTEEELRNLNLTDDEEKAAEYWNTLTEKLQTMQRNLMQEAIRDIPPKFTQDQLVTKMLDIADRWGISAEAKNDLRQLIATQEAFYEAQKERLGADFENLPPQQQLQRVIERFNLQGELPDKVRSHYRAMGLDMPHNLGPESVQGFAENIVKNSSLSRGSFLMKATGALAGLWLVTGTIANLIVPAVGLTMNIATNIHKPKEVSKILNTAWSKKGAFFKRMLTMGAVAGGAAVVLSDNPLQTVRNITASGTRLGGSAYSSAVEGAGNVVDRMRGRTPTLQILTALRGMPANNSVLTENYDQKDHLLREFYTTSDSFDFGKLNNIQSQQEIDQLKNLTMPTDAPMTPEVRAVYQRGQERLEAASGYFGLLHEFARRYQVSQADMQAIKSGDLANTLLRKYDSMQNTDPNMFQRIGNAASSAYGAVRGAVSRPGETLMRPVEWVGSTHLWNVVVNNIGRGRETGYAQVYWGGNIPEAPGNPEQITLPPSTMLTNEDLQRTGLKIPENLTRQEPYLSEAPKIFVTLLAFVRKIKNPNAFTGMAQ